MSKITSSLFTIFLSFTVFGQMPPGPGGNPCTNCPPATYTDILQPYEPGLKVAVSELSDTNFYLNLVEADPAGTYSIYYASNLDSSWQMVTQGISGQTDFTLMLPQPATGFFRASRTDTPVTNTADMAISFPGYDVNSNLITAIISDGPAAAMAVLIDDTNFADARWIPFSSVPYVLLGTNDGTYNIEFGFIGSDGQTNWTSDNITLDTVPPVLTITNPTSSAVSGSTVQVQGYANKSLKQVVFDVSNAAGNFTNQEGYVTSQFYDTNLMAYTTSYFQCPVDLVSGENFIAVHAADWAGNVGTTNISVTMNPGSLTVTPVWPTDGAQIVTGGDDITLEAHVSDPTAAITATISDDYGDTDTVRGIVERDGTVWVRNLPLLDDSNNIVLTAITGTETNQATLTVYWSYTVLLVDPLSADELNQPSVTVQGYVNDPTAAVYVNGVEAYGNGYGDWEADDVPVSSSGTAILNVEVYSGEQSEARRSKSFAPKDSATLIGSELITQPQPIRVAMMSYSGSHMEIDNTETGKEESHESIHWFYQSGGTCDNDFDPFAISSSQNGTADADLGWIVLPFDMPWEYASLSVFLPYLHFSTAYQSSLQTRIMVEASGQAQAGTTNTYLLLANANEFSISNMIWSLPAAVYGAPYEDLISGLGTSANYFGYHGDVSLPPEWLQINGQTLINAGTTDSVYSVNDHKTIYFTWGATIVHAPSGKNWDVTPSATQVHENWDYTFNLKALDLTHVMAVDNNRDGQITFDNVDRTGTANPYRFWINDSQESGDIVSGSDTQIPGQSYFNANYSLIHVNGRSDLVNFFLVALSLSNVLQWLPLTNGFEYRLSQNDAGLPTGLGNGAVKFIYTSLTPTNAFDYLTNTAASGYGVNLDEAVTNADTVQVKNSPGTILDTNWLTHVQNNGGKGVILLEGCADVTQPLMLEIWRDGKELGNVPLYLDISGVEQMFRHYNLCSYGNGTIEVDSRFNAPNEPQTDGKNLVFVHGYNVNQQEARGVESEMFKRFYWSGSKAKFYGVTWNGAESKEDPAIQALPQDEQFTPNYHTNVVNALDTAQAFANFLGGLSGQSVVVAHSLGNMVVLSAISDYNAAPGEYFMLDAAVPMEAVQGDVANESAMIYSTWQNYSNRLYASDWWQLFTNTDARSTLTWNNRFDNLGNVDIYNFYSSGEEVLREYDSDPPSDVSDALLSELIEHYWDSLPFGTYAWVWQEKGKGTCEQNGFIGSTHGGWAFNSYYSSLTTNQANALQDSELQTNAFFDFSSDSINGDGNPGTGSFQADMALYDSGGNTYAQANRNRILSDAIPALTLPVGANYVTNLDTILGGTANFNMTSTDLQNSWPQERLDSLEGNNWHHSDFDYVAYPFTYKLFNQIVNLENPY